jgi:hypothetical protein
MFTLKIRLSKFGLGIAKAALARRYPDLKSSHRCEALARGLGFRSYAAALAAVSQAESPICQANAQAFRDYLHTRDFVVGHQSLYQAVARVALDEVLIHEPELLKHGIGGGRPQKLRGDIWEGPVEFRKRSEDERAYLRSDEALEPFLLSLALLGRVTRTRSIRPDTSSYWVKHIAENYSSSYPEGGALGPQYVPNGVLIAAALHAGFHITRLRDELGYQSQIVRFNMSARSLDDLNLEIRPHSGRAQDRFRREEQRFRNHPTRRNSNPSPLRTPGTAT